MITLEQQNTDEHRSARSTTGQAQAARDSRKWNAASIGVIIGLGNPGSDYKNTYHNIGLGAIDWFCENYGHEKSTAQKTVKGFFEYRKENSQIWIKSTVSMNESGAAVRQALKYFNLRPEEILIIHDDSDLEIGSIKLSWNRGSAGHKGIESVIRHLDTKKLWRLRIGIRPRPQNNAERTQNNAESLPRKSASSPRKSAARRMRAEEFVLKKIRRSDEKILRDAFENAAEIIGLAPHEN